jgi:uncharacterized protein (DUF2267 family)
MHEQRLIDRVKARMGGGNDAEAAVALEATLMTLGERMNPAHAAAVARELPPRWASELLRRGHQPGLVALDEFYQRAARRERQPLITAVEHAQAVCRALCDTLSAEALAELRVDVWPELLRPSLEDRYAPGAGGHGTTLATGRGGSRHPLSEAHPPRAHAESVVHADNPHGARKLSSGSR